jgi:arylsulfatase A-like enzyme
MADPPMLRSLFVIVLISLVASVAAAQPAKPNVLLIYADDLGYGDLSSYNARSAWRTPQLDALAAQGMRFTDAHSASALCTPSRYALLTGRYAWRGPLKQGVTQGYSAPLVEPGRLTLARLLQQQGYVTAMLGKWHLGLDWVRTGPQPADVDFSQPVGGGPTAHGFDSFFGISASLDMPPYVWIKNDRITQVPTRTIGDSPSPKLWRGGAISDDFQLEDVQPRLTSRTIGFLRTRASATDGKPFFLYLALASPHTPILLTPEFAGRTGTTPYGDFVAQVDADIGHIMAALAETGLDRNTLVIFTSDNGFAPAADIPPHASIGHDPSGGLRGFKSDLYEGGHRVPYIARWPGVVPAGVTSAVTIGQLDLLATLAEVVGTRLPPDAGEDSVSLLPVLRGETNMTSARGPVVHHSAEGRFAIRDGRWKLLLWPGSGGWSSPTPNPSVWLKVPASDLSTLPPYQLYDLEADPAESTNLAAAHPEVVQRLGRHLRQVIEDGRSTAGPAQPYDRTLPWSQLSWTRDFQP